MQTTAERSSGRATNGVANDDASAHAYTREEESAVRAVIASSPPWPFIQRSCASSMTSVASAGVL